MRVLTGIQPSADPHLGNYFGAMSPVLNLAEKNPETFIFIADWHAMTTVESAEILKKNSRNLILDYLALGLNFQKTIFYRQSQIPEIPALAWILATVAPMGLLERAHSFKDKTARGLESTVGLFFYPVLMAADILLFDAEIVPVGRDQKQHLEIARDLAAKFNHKFGETFKLPAPQISENVAIVPGIDGEKMSKSYGNFIEIFADEKTVFEKVAKIKTDSAGISEPKNRDSILVKIAELFLDENEIEKFCRGGVGNSDFKKNLAEKICEKFAPAKKRRDEFAKNSDDIFEFLKRGEKKAREIAAEKFAEIRRKVGV